eukprot:TRINITY_DN4739_c0_g1_i1.p1 TRINITY_DN4739_c0_g1~~TRINITY_DN4739_c0_g1_i1.p1  ORF type:complete len:194 (-),score=43.91 TRINITY_DN4739_c0_g1_i1:85-666(-)
MDYVPDLTPYTPYFDSVLEYSKNLAATLDASSCEETQGLAGFLSAIGAVFAIFFANAGAAYGIAVSFYGYVNLAMAPRVDRLMLIKGLIPAVMASVRGVYGLIIGVLITVAMTEHYPLYAGIAHMFSGLAVGLSGIASGYCMGEIGHFGLRAVAKKPQLFVSVVLIIIFAEAIGLYGLIISLIVLTNGNGARC